MKVDKGLGRADSRPTIFLEFGPTAVVENALVPMPLVDPDYTKVFVTRQAAEGDGLDLIHQSPVGLDDMLAGLSSDDTRLRIAVLDAIAANGSISVIPGTGQARLRRDGEARARYVSGQSKKTAESYASAARWAGS